ncbi:MAG: T9SS type A sorting domain-containing protein [Sphingobacteriales bacterium]|nr:MAG: T9SS type A sorting domain-containing protein [Sphingobacteriales bacterium]
MGYLFRLEALDSEGNPAYSNPVINFVSTINVFPKIEDAKCFGNADGSIELIAANALANYSYSWSHSGETTPMVNNLSAGSYSVTISTAECSVTAQYIVEQPAALTAATMLTNATCATGASGGASVSVSGGTGSYSYEWSNGATTPHTSGLEAGVYTITVTDSNGCMVTESATIIDQATSGNFTIDATQPASATNFTSFANMVSGLSDCGITGPVVIDVVSGTGPYNEQLLLNTIPGSSAVNTVTINGNGNVLSLCSNNSTIRDVVRLNGTDNISISGLVIEAGCGFGWGVHLMNGNENVTLSNNTINLNVVYSIYGGNMQGIIAGNSAIDPAAMAGTLSNVSIAGNTINNGYHGIRINGNTTSRANAVSLTNNTLNTTVMYGILASYADNLAVNQNVVNMKNVAMSQDQNSIGVYLVYVENGLSVQRNRIMNAGNQGLFLNYINQSSSTRGTVANNMIGGGLRMANLALGMQLNAASYLDVYYNSVNADFGTTGIAFYITNALSRYLNVVNNSFAYTGAGAEGRAMHANDAAANFTELNYNNYFSTGGRFVYFNRAFRTNLAGLQGSTENGIIVHDANSKSVNPLYVTSTDLHIQAASLLRNSALPLASVTVDYDGEARTGTPTMGADEYIAGSPRYISAELPVKVYPNPFATGFKVDVTSLTGQVQLNLVDMMGRQVYSTTFDASAAVKEVAPQVQLSQGVYMLQVTNNGVTSQFRVVKQ